ncbi:hypothetical protein D3C87_2038200 [compost metagenome]
MRPGQKTLVQRTGRSLEKVKVLNRVLILNCQINDPEPENIEEVNHGPKEVRF